MSSADLALDYLRQSDAALAELINRLGVFALPLPTTSSTFAALAEAIVYQQLHGRAAAAIFGRLAALFPELSAEHVLAASDEQLRGAGLSRAKLLSIRDLARKTVDGEVPTLAEAEALEDEAIVERLGQVGGIGRWTAQMFLIFRLGRPDVLPVDDYGIRKGFALAFGLAELPSPKTVAAHGERWRPHRTAASWYLWRAAEVRTPGT